MADEKRVLIDFSRDIWFGFPGSELSHKQKMRSIDFDEYLSQWLLDNVGEFGKEWWAEVDKEHDSMRAVFKDAEMETWVLMTWCDDAD
jgi:hypothetical protein